MVWGAGSQFAKTSGLGVRFSSVVSGQGSAGAERAHHYIYYLDLTAVNLVRAQTSPTPGCTRFNSHGGNSPADTFDIPRNFLGRLWMDWLSGARMRIPTSSEAYFAPRLTR